MIDWAATGQMFAGVGTLAGAIAIIVAAILGREAVASFRRQKQVERQIEHAEKALTVAYQLQEALGAIRSPLTTAHELASSREELETKEWFAGLTDSDKDRTVQANVFFQRIRSFDETFSAALSVMPFVKAYFGEDAESAFKRLIHSRHSVRVYADAYAKDRGHDPAFSRKIDGYIWEGAAIDGEDPVATQVSDSIAVLERHLLPIIREMPSQSKVATSNG